MFGTMSLQGMHCLSWLAIVALAIVVPVVAAIAPRLRRRPSSAQSPEGKFKPLPGPGEPPRLENEADLEFIWSMARAAPDTTDSELLAMIAWLRGMVDELYVQGVSLNLQMQAWKEAERWLTASTKADSPYLRWMRTSAERLAACLDRASPKSQFYWRAESETHAVLNALEELARRRGLSVDDDQRHQWRNMLCDVLHRSPDA